MHEFLYVGTWNNIAGRDGLGHAQGVYGWRVDVDQGRFEPLGLVATTRLSADSLAVTPDGHTLFVTAYNSGVAVRSWPFPGAPRCSVGAYAVDAASGRLRPLGEVDAQGDMPAELRTDASGRTLALVNYDGGNVVAWRIEADGRLGALTAQLPHQGTGRREVPGPHPHGLAFSADNRRLFVPDLGLDRLYVYRFDAEYGTLGADDPPFIAFDEGEGPRQVAAHPNGHWIYVSTEDGGLVHQLQQDAAGRWQRLQSVSIVADDAALRLGSAQARLSPDGRFLYVGHRPGQHLTVFEIDAASGNPGLVQRADTRADPRDGAQPSWADKTLWQKVQTGARSFAWDSHARWVVSANLGEDALVVLQRDAHSGRLQRHGAVLAVPQPSFAVFVRPR